MIARKFQFRMRSEYQTVEDNAISNKVSKLVFEHLVNQQWQEYDPRNFAGGFLVLLYAILNCQHTYFRANATEQGIGLNSCEGSLIAETNADWELLSMHINFDAKLAAGNPTQKDSEYIVDRMRQCPVSVNLKSIPDLKTTINFK